VNVERCGERCVAEEDRSTQEQPNRRLNVWISVGFGFDQGGRWKVVQKMINELGGGGLMTPSCLARLLRLSR